MRKARKREKKNRKIYVRTYEHKTYSTYAVCTTYQAAHLYLCVCASEYHYKCMALRLQSNMFFINFIAEFGRIFILSILKSRKMHSSNIMNSKVARRATSAIKIQVKSCQRNDGNTPFLKKTNTTSKRCEILSIAPNFIAFSLFYARFSCAYNIFHSGFCAI